MINITELLVDHQLTVRAALERLNQTGEGILLLVDAAGALLRTVTDGDLRRVLLAGKGLDSTLAELPAQRSVVITADDRDGALALMIERGISQLPVLDAAGRPVEILLRRDLDQRILLSTPHLGEFEMEYVEDAFRTNWIAPLGPNVDAFEREVAAHVGIGHAAALVSGTAALHLALRLVGVARDDLVFCSSLTFAASANPILYEGAQPIFIDADPATWNMSVPALERALADAASRGRLPKAVMVVNLYGQSADYDPINALCARYGVTVIEDAAESLGATYKGRASGTLARVGAYSFNGNKIITTSGGGMLISDDRALVEKARFLSTQAREPVPWYEHREIGFNYRMSNVLAGIGRGQMRVLEDRVRARRRIFDRYVAGLAGCDAIEWMPEAPFGRSTRWLSVGMLDTERTHLTPTALIDALAAQGIEARHVWKPMHAQPLYAACPYFSHEPGASFADKAFARGICLPSGSNMTDAQQDRIIAAISTILRRNAGD